MKKLVFCIFLALLMSRPAQGESEKQMEARYGKSILLDKYPGYWVLRRYVVKKITVTVVFFKGSSVEEHYFAKALSSKEIDDLLDLNSHGSTWKEKPPVHTGKERNWALDGNSAVASLTSGKLIVIDKKYNDENFKGPSHVYPLPEVLHDF